MHRVSAISISYFGQMGITRTIIFANPSEEITSIITLLLGLWLHYSLFIIHFSLFIISIKSKNFKILPLVGDLNFKK